MKKSNTLGALKKTDYTPLSIQQELVQNLIDKVKKDRTVTIEEVVVAEEKVIFKLPKELD